MTPNRRTLGRPDEIIGPYHDVEYDRQQLRDLCSPYFDEIQVHGLFGSSGYLQLYNEELRPDPMLVVDFELQDDSIASCLDIVAVGRRAR